MHCIRDAKSAAEHGVPNPHGIVPFSSHHDGSAAVRAQRRRQIRRNARSISAKLSGFLALCLLGCGARDPDARDAGLAGDESATSRVARAVALGRGRFYDAWLATALADPSAAVRHAAAAALAGIDEPAATTALAAALASSDVAMVGRSARGLGVSFRALDEHACDALAVALVRLQSTQEEAALTAVAHTLGKCDSADAEPMLRNLLAAHEDAALAGLARLARSRKKLQAATFEALLDRALGNPAAEAHLLACLEPLSLATWTVKQGRRLLAAPRPSAVALAKIYGQLGATAQLEELAMQAGTDLAARAARFEALRALAKGIRGEAVFARALGALVPAPGEAPATWAQTPRGATFSQILGLAPAQAYSEALRIRLVTTAAIESATPSARLDALRCAAAGRIAKRAFDSAPLIHCAPEGSLPFELNRLVALERSPLRGARLPHFEALLQSKNLRVREAALAAIAAHPEAVSAPWGLAAVTRALGSPDVGEVIAALEVVDKLPDARTPDLTAAYAEATTRAWPADAAELFEALLKTGRARHLPAGQALARTLGCHAAQPVRQLAREMVQDAPACASLTGLFADPPAASTTVILQSTAGSLTLHLDAAAAPASVATVVRLARAGFYSHVEMHRVVPGFVVQFGDPAGDGYGGAGGLLQHETSGHGFTPLRIGLAHAGFDTASSQLFVTTGPAPHLDGDYTWLGTAEGPWQDVVQGDVVSSVQIVQQPR